MSLMGLEVLAASGTGVQIRLGGVPISTGSWFQYYEPGWSKGYYSSKWNQQQVKKTSEGYLIHFKSADGLVEGLQDVRVSGNRVHVEYSFGWNGKSPVNVEVCAAMLWAPAWADGSIDSRSLKVPLEGATPAERSLSNAFSFSLASPLGTADFKAPRPWLLFDARGYNQDWAKSNSLFWLGKTEVTVEPGKLATESFSLEVNVTQSAAREEVITVEPVRVNRAFEPPGSIPTLIPKPKETRLESGVPIDLKGLGTSSRRFNDFQEGVLRRWQTALPSTPAILDSIDPKVSRPEGYAIRIQSGRIEVVGHDEAGLRNGLRRLAALTFAHQGKLVLPSGTLTDWPTVSWRGAHLFIGPKADEFQKRLWSSALLDLGFNHVVLQCERANWEAIPGTQTAITMDKRRLGDLVNWYRKQGVEPIPLVQSFGHMEWLFANGKNLDLAFNKNALYSIDPRVPRSRDVLDRVWEEVIALFKPKVIHFGLDEVDMRGWPDDPKLVTELWSQQVGYLGELATKHDVKMMLWGDKALAPGEAPDATHGDDATEARKRRDALPRGAFIADWHYKADPKPETFQPVLQLWKREGFVPVASMWNRHENIQGFTRAAIREGAGTLQTTWAGYESGENSLLNNFNQYAAFLIAGEYAWSGRDDATKDFGYNPESYLQRVFFGRPQPLGPQPGLTVGGQIRRLGPYSVGTLGWEFQDVLTKVGRVRPGKIATRVKGRGAELLVFVQTTHPLDFGSEVATVKVGKSQAAILYGHHVRAVDDRSVSVRCETYDGWSVFRVPVGTKDPMIEVAQTQPHAGLRVLGLLLL